MSDLKKNVESLINQVQECLNRISALEFEQETIKQIIHAHDRWIMKLRGYNPDTGEKE